MNAAQKIKANQLDHIYMNIEASVLTARRYLKDDDNKFNELRGGAYGILNESIRENTKIIDNILDPNPETIIIYKSASLGPTGSFNPLVCLRGAKLLSVDQHEEINKIMLLLKQKCYEYKIHVELTINK